MKIKLGIQVDFSATSRRSEVCGYVSGGGGRKMREQPFPGGEHPSRATSEMYFNPLPGARAATWNVKNDPPRTHAGRFAFVEMEANDCVQ